jgi:hypothetical protein
MPAYPPPPVFFEVAVPYVGRHAVAWSRPVAVSRAWSRGFKKKRLFIFYEATSNLADSLAYYPSILDAPRTTHRDYRE